MGRLGLIIGAFLGISLVVGGISLTVFHREPSPVVAIVADQAPTVVPKNTRTVVPPTITSAPSTITPIPPTMTIAATSTTVPSPTALPSPTPDPTIRAHAVKALTIYSQPDESYKERGTLALGDQMTVLHRGGQWFEVEANGAQGWVYREWIDLSSEQADRVPIYPDSMPVIVGKVVESYDYGYATYKGRVMNVGLKTAYGVKAEVEAFDSAHNRVALDSSFVDGIDLAPGEQRSFMIMTPDNGIESYILRLDWQENTKNDL